MAGYVGNEQQQRLQARAEELIPWAQTTRGACNPGRFPGSDDPEALGWETIFELLDKEGVFGFRLLSANTAELVRERCEERGYRVDFWDVFSAPASLAASSCSKVLLRGLPEGLKVVKPGDGPNRIQTRVFQDFMLENGIVPFSASMLKGAFGKVVTLGLQDAQGKLAATAHGYLPHNSLSPHAKNAWGGLVAVAPPHRGKGLGLYINALMISACATDLDAQDVHELVSAGNTVSRRMIETCGLKFNPSLKCGIAVSSGERFTR